MAELIGQAMPPRLARHIQPLLHARLAAPVARVRLVVHADDVRGIGPGGRVLAKARELALLFLGGTLPEGDDPAEAERLMEEFNLLICMQAGASNFKSDRLDRSVRASRGLQLLCC